jgi:hypothetical protein
VILELVVLASGIFIVVWPEKLQKIAIRHQERHRNLAALNPFADWIKSPSFLVAPMACGFVLIVFSVVVLYFAWKACSA